jgi:methionyl-tRNA formyltransferase
MRIAIIGQQEFGKAVMEAFLARGDTVAGVFVAPEQPGSRPDAVRLAAAERRLPVFQFASYRTAEAQEALRSLDVELGVMAYVLVFAPQAFVSIPRHGTIQYHPSLLPRHRGPSSINWPMIQGAARTGLTIFRPTDGLDEGPVILQKSVEIGADETLGDVYFNKLFPLGVQALLEAADLVVRGRHSETVQNETEASYEGWCREAEARIEWARPVDQIYDLIRACNPAPGAWTTFQQDKLQIFDCRKIPVRRLAEVKGRVGEIAAVSATSFAVTAHGGRIEVLRVRFRDGKKVGAGEFATEAKIVAGTRLGS